MKRLDIVIAGVGGQGTLLASKILGALALRMGLPVKVSEVHGMAQRGGSVVTYVRIGEGAASPLVDPGCADYVLAFELMEAVRALPYLKKGGTLIANTQRIAPMPVVTGAATYPEDLADALRASADAKLLNAHDLACEAGEPRAVNLVLLGVLCARLALDRALWQAAIADCLPQRLLAVNLRAFEAGCALAEGEGR